MRQNAIGIDIGGANLKLADTHQLARSRPFALWKHPAQLAAELQDFTQDIPPEIAIGITMTGELCDCFETKREGVYQIVTACEAAFRTRPRGYWSTEGAFVSAELATSNYLHVAAANWHAQSTFAGRFAADGFSLLLDMGSTTTDIIPLVHRLPCTDGLTDVERMQSSELLYFGSRRTPVCAIEPTLAAEFFATMHDVNVVLEKLPEELEHRDTADGRPMTRNYAADRLARMLGGDRETVTTAEINALASSLYDKQQYRLRSAVRRIIARVGQPLVQIITSGSGEFMLRELVTNDFPTTLHLSLSNQFSAEISTAACAYAVAMLMAERC